MVCRWRQIGVKSLNSEGNDIQRTGSFSMATTYKQKLIGEINAIPEDLMPRFYRIVRTLRAELTHQTAVTPKRGSLRGIWGGWRLMNRIFLQQKNPSSLMNTRMKSVELRHRHPFACLVFYRWPASEQKGPQVIWGHGQRRPDNCSDRCFGRDTFYSQERPDTPWLYGNGRENRGAGQKI